MRHSARSGDAQLHIRSGRPSEPALAPGVHELAEPSRLSKSRGSAALLFVPTSTAANIPLLVFFHGAGGSAASSLRLVKAAATEHGCLVLLPNSIGSTWDFIASAWGPDVNRLPATLEVVLDHFAVSQVAFAGFSDGASYALSVCLANGELAHTVLAFSPGFAAPPDRVGRPRVWISHGTEDAVLPIDRCARPLPAGSPRPDTTSTTRSSPVRTRCPRTRSIAPSDGGWPPPIPEESRSPAQAARPRQPRTEPASAWHPGPAPAQTPAAAPTSAGSATVMDPQTGQSGRRSQRSASVSL